MGREPYTNLATLVLELGMINFGVERLSVGDDGNTCALLVAD